jgi:hypothetical protein
MATTKTVTAEAVLETKMDVDKDVEDTRTRRKKRKTLTNWNVLYEGGFIPVTVKCDTYKGGQPSEHACKTRFVPNSENIIRHMDPLHGGGWFKMRLRISDSKKAEIWKELEDAGVEIQEFHCPHCRQEVMMTPRNILHHLQNHPGATRHNFEPQTLAFTLSFDKPEQGEEESLFIDESEEN